MRSSGRRRVSSRAACRPVIRGIETSRIARSISSRSAELDGLGAVAGLGDDLEVGLGVEHHPQPAADERVVVGEQDARLQRDGSCRLAGRHARRTRVPPPGPGLDRQAAADQQRPLAHARRCRLRPRHAASRAYRGRRR